jgi:biotin carboxyl carrier protein
MKLKRIGDGREFEVEIIGHDGQSLRVRIDGEEHAVEVTPATGGVIVRMGERPRRLYAARSRDSILVAAGPAQFDFVAIEGSRARGAHALATPAVAAPMPGKVLKVLVEQGQTVAAGAPLVVLEAMKMETTLYAEGAAVVKKINVSAGQMVDHGAVMLELSPAPADSSPNESPAEGA